jgi:hypothetical protein
MKLNIFDRMKLGVFLPERASFEQAIIASDIRTKIKITQDEIKQYAIQTQGNAVRWSEIGNTEYKDFEFTKLEIDLLKRQLDKLSKEGNIETTPEFITLCNNIRAEKGE